MYNFKYIFLALAVALMILPMTMAIWVPALNDPALWGIRTFNSGYSGLPEYYISIRDIPTIGIPCFISFMVYVYYDAQDWFS